MGISAAKALGQALQKTPAQQQQQWRQAAGGRRSSSSSGTQAQVQQQRNNTPVDVSPRVNHQAVRRQGPSPLRNPSGCPDHGPGTQATPNSMVAQRASSHLSALPQQRKKLVKRCSDGMGLQGPRRGRVERRAQVTPSTRCYMAAALSARHQVLPSSNMGKRANPKDKDLQACMAAGAWQAHGEFAGGSHSKV